MTSESLLDNLTDLFERARSEVPIYGDLYRKSDNIKSLADFAQLPVLTKSVLSARGLKGTLANGVKLCLTRTYEDAPAKDYVPRMLSYEDAVDDFEAFDFFIKPLTKEDDVSHRMLVLGDELHTYAIAELANQLAYYEFPLATFIVRNQNEAKLIVHLDWFRPTAVFLNASYRPADFDSVRYLFTFNKLVLSEGQADDHQTLVRFDILQDTFVGPLAIRRSNQTAYRFDPDYFYFENTDDHGLLVTLLTGRLQPLIRYKLPYHGLVSADTLTITGN